MTKEEIWKDIDGYKDIYQVSNRGNIRSLDRTISRTLNGSQKVKGQPIVSCRSNRGYMMVSLNRDHRMNFKSVHRLVAIAFVSGFAKGLQVNHIDGNKQNNNDWNLEWCTPSQNVKHAHDLGLKINPTKFDLIQKLTVKSLRGELRKADIMAHFKMGKSTIDRIFASELKLDL